MKKIYLDGMMMLGLILLISATSFAQDMITGGNMENENDWATCALNTGADNTVTYEFGFTDVRPSEGINGCLHVVGTNTGTGDGQGTNFMFYQQVTLQRGVPYTFDLAYKDVRTEKYWFEAYVGGTEPAVGGDYSAGAGIIKIGGWKWSTWEVSCPSDEFDATFVETACIADGINPFTIEGTGDTSVYVGFRMGIWDDASGGLSFEVYIDNVSLTGPETSIRNYTDPNRVNVFPNPASGMITIANIGSDDIRIFNLAGQEVLQFIASGRIMNLDVSGLNKGMYLLKSGGSATKLMIE